MIARRNMIGGGVAASLFGTGGAAAQAPDRAALEEIASAIRDIRRTFEERQDFHEVVAIRQRITEFLRQQMKFPDFLDVGTDAWYSAYDWHVRNAQPIVFGRDPAGRYTLLFMATALVLRPDLVQNYIGPPYDNR